MANKFRETKMESQRKEQIRRAMSAAGYPTYAWILSQRFALNFYRPRPGDKPFAAAMVPGKNVIIINPDITDNAFICMLIRHEIMHEYMKHHDRLLKHLYDKLNAEGVTADNGETVEKHSLEEVERMLYSNSMANQAADYELSNEMYTEKDKDMQRNVGRYLKVNANLRGLVTEDDHPDWVNLSVEEMYDKLTELMEQAKKEAEEQLQKDEEEGVVRGVFLSKKSFFAPQKGVIYVGGEVK